MKFDSEASHSITTRFRKCRLFDLIRDTLQYRTDYLFSKMFRDFQTCK